VLHVTSDQERSNLAAFIPDAPIALIGNGIDLPDAASLAFSGAEVRSGIRQALFLGRLHPVKGLPLLLRAWHLAAPVNWRLVIAGPDEMGHRELLEGEVARLGLADDVTFTGPVTGVAKTQLLAESRLFVLPSYSESFGMAAGEALAHGLPVLTTKNVPWPQIEDLACGWRVDSTVEALAAALAEATNCQDRQLAEMGRRGRMLITDDFGWDKITESFIGLYSNMLMNRENQF
jgi:glycosyltransferase involved in cell wall biosynthesis